MADEDPPKLTIASSRPEAEIRREREQATHDHQMHEIEGCMRELAANMIRIIRGAGQPLDLFDQVIGLFRAIERAPDQATVGQINRALEAALCDGLPGNDKDEIYDAITDIEAASLRKIAARILHQPIQVTAGESDFRTALRRLEQARTERRKKLDAQEAAESLARAQRILRPTAKRAAERKKPRKSKVQAITTPKLRVPPKPLAVEHEPKRPRSTAEFMKARQKELRGEDE